MKRDYLKGLSTLKWMVVAMIFALASCTDNTTDYIEPPTGGDTGDTWTFPSKISVNISSGTSTRVGFENDGANGIKQVWQSGDQFKLYNTAGETAIYTLEKIDQTNASQAIFKIDGTKPLQGTSFTAVYMNGGDIKVDFNGSTPEYIFSMLGQNQNNAQGNAAFDHLKKYDLLTATVTSPKQEVVFNSQCAMFTFVLKNIPTDIGTPESIMLNSINYYTGESLNAFITGFGDKTLYSTFTMGLSDYPSSTTSITAYMLVPPFDMPEVSNLCLIIQGSEKSYQYMGFFYNQFSYKASTNYTFEVTSWDATLPTDVYTAAMDNTVKTNNDQNYWATIAPPGTGTKSNPYVIQSAWNLAWFKKNYAAHPGAYYTMTTDIECENGLNWLPIGGSISDTPFTGNFDAGSSQINALNVTLASSKSGFFGSTENATISNLQVNGTLNTTSEGIGGIVGIAKNTTFNGCVSRMSITNSGLYVGGMVGAVENCTFTNCTNMGNIKGTEMYVGGLIGGALSTNTSTKITGCKNSATISGSASVGGIIGYINSGNAIVTSCVNTGNVSATSFGGAIVGQSEVGNSVLGTGNTNTGIVTIGGKVITPTPLVGTSSN